MVSMEFPITNCLHFFFFRTDENIFIHILIEVPTIRNEKKSPIQLKEKLSEISKGGNFDTKQF